VWIWTVYGLAYVVAVGISQTKMSIYYDRDNVHSMHGDEINITCHMLSCRAKIIHCIIMVDNFQICNGLDNN